MIRLGNSSIKKIFLGSSEVTSVYKGTEKICFNEQDYSQDYLTFVALEDGTFSFTNEVQYSLDGGSTWSTLTAKASSPSLSTGNEIMWKANLTPKNGGGIGNFSSSAKFNVKGNLMSLLFGDGFKDKTSLSDKNYAFNNLFNGCGSLVSAKKLSLPATTLANYCYYRMFYNCASLTTAPVLPATTLADYCYKEMFNNCKSLEYIKCLATDISASGCLTTWVFGVATNGTFVKAADMDSWPSGAIGIPNGWTVKGA